MKHPHITDGKRLDPASKKRIYVAITTFLPQVGGAEKQALIQGRSMLNRGYAPTIITFRHNKDWPVREVIDGVSVIRTAGALLGRREKLPRILQKMLFLLAMLAMGWTLWYHRQRYDVLHVYQLSLLALVAAYVCRLTQKPLVVSVRNANPGKMLPIRNKVSLLAGPLDSTASWLQVHGPTQVSGDLEGLERFGKPVVRHLRSLLARIHAVVVVLSSSMQDYLIQHDFDLAHIQLIPNGVDITRFYPAPVDISLHERAHTVICISRLSYQKGIDVLLQAWKLVLEQLPQARLILAGSGDLQPQFSRMARELSIVERVEFAGLQSDVTAQFHRGSLAVLPSRCEGMSNALLEAMACGLPCVATRVSGSEDLITSGINGLLVEPEDYAGLAQALLTLLHDPLLAQRYARAARATIEKHFSLDYIAEKYVELYQQMMGSGTGIAEPARPPEIYHLPSSLKKG